MAPSTLSQGGEKPFHMGAAHERAGGVVDQDGLLRAAGKCGETRPDRLGAGATARDGRPADEALQGRIGLRQSVAGDDDDDFRGSRRQQSLRGPAQNGSSPEASPRLGLARARSEALAGRNDHRGKCHRPVLGGAARLFQLYGAATCA